jgi:uncharacterized protein YkwD
LLISAGRYNSGVHTRGSVVIAVAAALFGCGDGVGHPILEPDQPGDFVSGTGGASGSGGGDPAAVGGTSGDTDTAGSGGTLFSPGVGKGGGAFGRTDGGDGGWNERGPREPTEKGVVPDGSVCEPVADWSAAADAEEQQLVQYLNFARESGFGCELEQPMQAGPLEVSPELRCAARLHSRDMSARGFFDHVNPDGLGPEERMRQAGATFRIASESIARVEGQGGPGEGARWQLSRLLMDRGADCKNVADPGFDRVGVGIFEGLLTLVFTGP